MKLNKHILFAFLIVALLASCSNKGKVQTQIKKVKIPLVKVQKSKIQTISSKLEIIGTVKPNIECTIKSTSAGVVNKLLVRENQWISKGQIVAVINPTDRIALIAKNKQEILQIKRKLKKNSSDSLVNQLSKVEKQLDLSKKMYSLIPVTSEISGIVSERYIEVGSQISTGDKLIEIYDPNSLIIKANINEKYFGALKFGQKINLKLNAYPEENILGKISLIYPKIDEATRSVLFDIKPQTKHKLLEGMAANIIISTQKHENALCIPDDAIQTGINDQYFVYAVSKDTTAIKIKVKTGISENGYTEIINGLNKDQMIVVKGQEMLNNGKKVKIQKAQKK